MRRKNRVTTIKIKGTYKKKFLKTLSTKLFGRFNGKFITEDIIIIDNNSKNVLLSESWSHDGAGASNTFLIDMLLLWL